MPDLSGLHGVAVYCISYIYYRLKTVFAGLVHNLKKDDKNYKLVLDIVDMLCYLILARGNKAKGKQGKAHNRKGQRQTKGQSPLSLNVEPLKVIGGGKHLDN